MREIKFRAWENETMYYQVRCGGVFDGIPTAPTYWDGHDWINMTGQPHTKVMQYSGLKDRDGVEIYEKDILLFNNSINNRKWVCVVEFRAGGFVCEYPKDGMYNHFDSWNVPKVTWEIIGNAFQNPELLEAAE